MAKVVFSFDDKSAKKLKNKKNILGGKGCLLYTSPSPRDP